MKISKFPPNALRERRLSAFVQPHTFVCGEWTGRHAKYERKKWRFWNYSWPRL